MTWRFIEPNKPIRTSEDFLKEVDGRYVIDAKLDGWRTEIFKRDNKVHFLSRANKVHEVPLSLASKFDDLPPGMSLDAEWINPTRIKAINSEHNVKLPMINVIIVFDVRWINDRYIANISLSDRRDTPYYQKLAKTTLGTLFESNNAVYKAISENGLKVNQFYSEQREHIISEGIIIKPSNSGLSGNWYKVKYR